LRFTDEDLVFGYEKVIAAIGAEIDRLRELKSAASSPSPSAERRGEESCRCRMENEGCRITKGVSAKGQHD